MHLVKSTDKPIKVTILLTDNQKMLPEKHNDGKLHVTILIGGTGLIACFFFVDLNAFGLALRLWAN